MYNLMYPISINHYYMAGCGLFVQWPQNVMMYTMYMMGMQIFSETSQWE